MRLCRNLNNGNGGFSLAQAFTPGSACRAISEPGSPGYRSGLQAILRLRIRKNRMRPASRRERRFVYLPNPGV